MILLAADLFTSLAVTLHHHHESIMINTLLSSFGTGPQYVSA